MKNNILRDLPHAIPEEVVTRLLMSSGIRIERIVSHGQASPPGFWYDQEEGEWVLVLAGAAVLEIEGQAETTPLGPGDYIDIPPRRRHRVAWTDPGQPTVWLAVFYTGQDSVRSV